MKTYWPAARYPVKSAQKNLNRWIYRSSYLWKKSTKFFTSGMIFHIPIGHPQCKISINLLGFHIKMYQVSTLHRVYSRHPGRSHLQHSLLSAASSRQDPLAKHLPSAWRQALVFPFNPLHGTPTQPVNHTFMPYCAAWPASTLAMATQIPADLAVKNRSSQKYERQSLIQCTHVGIVPETKTSWSDE